MDELTENAEEPDEGEKPEVQKLGKLQYKVIMLENFVKYIRIHGKILCDYWYTSKRSFQRKNHSNHRYEKHKLVHSIKFKSIGNLTFQLQILSVYKKNYRMQINRTCNWSTSTQVNIVDTIERLVTISKTNSKIASIQIIQQN